MQEAARAFNFSEYSRDIYVLYAAIYGLREP